MVEISIKDFSFIYQGSSELALNTISLNISQGSFILITGASGSGKSTLVDSINGLIPHRYRGKVKGQVCMDGVDWFDIDYSILSQKIGLVRQDPDSQLACKDVRSEVAFGPANLCLSHSEIKKRVSWALKSVNGLNLIERDISTLSGGEKQRIAIASMLAMKPEVLILDEPSSFLDIPAMQTLYKSLNTLRRLVPNMTLIIVDHELINILPLINQLIIMKKGEIFIKGNPCLMITERLNEIENAGVRIHPALFHYCKECILSNSQNIFNLEENFNYNKLNKLLLDHLRSFKKFNEEVQPAAKDPLLEVHDISFSYPNNNNSGKKINQNGKKIIHAPALNKINFKIHEGEFICLMGNNGSGKTTLLRILGGQLKPDSGAMLYQGHDLNTLRDKEYFRHIGIIFQNPEHQFFKRSVLDEIFYGPDNFGIKRKMIDKYVNSLIKHLKLEQYLSQLPFCLSWGEKRRVNIASVLSYLPSILLLDEIFIGQDLHNIMILLKILKTLNQKLKTTTIIVSHKPEIILTLANRAILIDKGEIILDGPPVRENLKKIHDFFYKYN